MERTIVTLCGISDENLALLSAQGVTSGVDLSMIDKDDIKEILPDALLMDRKKLAHVGRFIAMGQTVTGTTTLPEIVGYLNSPTQVQVPPPGPVQPPTYAPDPSRGAPKLYVNSLTEFNGQPIEYEAWELVTKSTLGQTVYGKLLDSPPTDGDVVMKARNKELYHMLMTALLNGSGMHILQDGSVTDDGHAAFAAIQAWYGSAATSRTIIDHYRKKVEGLTLDQNTTASEFVNVFIICCQKLESKNEGYSAATKKQRFLDQILDDDYDVVKQHLQGDTSLLFDDCVKRIRQREQELSSDIDNTLKKARRFKKDETPGSSSSNETKIPSIPNHVLDRVKPSSAKRDLVLWRGTWNREGRVIRPDELTDPHSEKDPSVDGKKRNRDDDSTIASNNERNTEKRQRKFFKKKKGRRVKLRQATSTSKSGIPKSTVVVSMKDSDESNCSDEYDDDDSMSDNDDTKKGSTPAKKYKTKKKQPKPKKGKGQRTKKIRRNPIARQNPSRAAKPRAIIDPGTELDVIGGVGWEVLSILDNQTALLGGALDGMGECSLPLVNAVTAYDHQNGSTTLLGVGRVGWDKRAEQTESLFNSHDLRKHGVTVDDTATRDGGLQRLVVDDVEIHLEFKDKKTLSFNLRRPTQEELLKLEIHWLTPRAPVQTNIYRKTARRSTGAVVPAPAPWDARLGYPPEMIAARTLMSTTQLCESPAEMDNREFPRQHRKTRLYVLHPRRIPGRTDSDTFFASELSIRKFACVQIFYCIKSSFLYVRGMRRESHSHGAYQDFVREIGAPNVLLTDNSKTQTGKKWRKTSRENVTRQIHTAPHNQNQNQAERQIGHLKHQTIQALNYSGAPIVFWCYCMYFIVDCINHSAKKSIDYRTPMELMYGMTPDISMFRFKFWEPVWYYEPTAKYPNPNFLPGRFVGIAWDHGDAFTYKIWTTPDDDWTDGHELVRNIVRSRSPSEVEPWEKYPDDTLTLVKTKQRARKSKGEDRRRKLQDH